MLFDKNKAVISSSSEVLKYKLEKRKNNNLIILIDLL